MNTRTTFMLLTSFLVILLFQNCGKVNFSSDSPTLLTSNTGTTGGGTDTPNGQNPPPETLGQSNSNVECDLGGANSKIVMSGVLETGSNNSATRVCMSQNACLNLINSYAQVRNCSLSKGSAVNSSALATCTQVFPGSNGTCNNAAVLSDAQIANILANMGS